MKKVISIALTFIIMIGLINTNSLFVRANNSAEMIDGSYLLNEESSEVVVEFLTRGAYLKSGSSSIVKAGTGKITAGGTTVAQKVVSSVSITVRVERLVNGTWQIYDSWSSTRYNAASASSSKVLSVPSGYYYRAHCMHYANSDASSSVSNGIWI